MTEGNPAWSASSAVSSIEGVTCRCRRVALHSIGRMQLVVLGTGEPLEHELRSLRSCHPGWVCFGGCNEGRPIASKLAAICS